MIFISSSSMKRAKEATQEVMSRSDLPAWFAEKKAKDVRRAVTAQLHPNATDMMVECVEKFVRLITTRLATENMMLSDFRCTDTPQRMWNLASLEFGGFSDVVAVPLNDDPLLAMFPTKQQEHMRDLAFTVLGRLVKKDPELGRYFVCEYASHPTWLVDKKTALIDWSNVHGGQWQRLLVDDNDRRCPPLATIRTLLDDAPPPPHAPSDIFLLGLAHLFSTAANLATPSTPDAPFAPIFGIMSVHADAWRHVLNDCLKIVACHKGFMGDWRFDADGLDRRYAVCGPLAAIIEMAPATKVFFQTCWNVPLLIDGPAPQLDWTEIIPRRTVVILDRDDTDLGPPPVAATLLRMTSHCLERYSHPTSYSISGPLAVLRLLESATQFLQSCLDVYFPAVLGELTLQFAGKAIFNIPHSREEMLEMRRHVQHPPVSIPSVHPTKRHCARIQQ